MVDSILDVCMEVQAMRDVTRGGLATVSAAESMGSLYTSLQCHNLYLTMTMHEYHFFVLNLHLLNTNDLPTKIDSCRNAADLSWVW